MKNTYEEKYKNRIQIHENEYNSFDLKSYEKGHEDGYDDGCDDTRFLAASLIYEHWQSFIDCCFINEEDEMDCINRMIKFFTVDCD